MTTHLELLESLKLPRYSNPDGPGSKFVGVVIGLLNDFLGEIALQAIQSRYLYPARALAPFEQPLDALEKLGNECMRPRYPGEHPINSHRARIRGKWAFWTGSPKVGMSEELEAAGMPDAEILVPNDFNPVPDPPEEWSRFWVRFPEGSHTITGPGAVVGSFVVGTDIVGPAGSDLFTLRLIKKIANDYKPVEFVCWDLQFVLPGGTEVIHLMVKKRFADPYYVYHEV